MAASIRFPWVGVSALVSCFVVSGVAWLRVPEESPLSDQSTRMPLLQLTRVDAEFSRASLIEQLAAYDPTPLFLPSPMSSSASSFGDEAGTGLVSPFDAIVPTLTKTGPLAFPPLAPIPRNVVAGLGLTEQIDAPLALARTEELVAPLVSRLGRVEAVDPESGRTVLALDLAVAVPMPEQDWQPLELLGAISRAGTVGDLVVSASSGSIDVDDFFRWQLREETRVGAHLPEGFYVFRIGP